MMSRKLKKNKKMHTSARHSSPNVIRYHVFQLNASPSPSVSPIHRCLLKQRLC